MSVIPEGYEFRRGRLMPKRGSKYGSKRAVGADGRKYDSRREAREAARLEQERQAGTIVATIPQVSIPIGEADDGKDVRLRVDFLVIHAINDDGTFVASFRDAKGFDTPAGKVKRAAMKRLYGVGVELA